MIHLVKILRAQTSKGVFQKWKLAKKNQFATHSVQKCLGMCENKQKLNVSEDIGQKIPLVTKYSEKISTSPALLLSCSDSRKTGRTVQNVFC